MSQLKIKGLRNIISTIPNCCSKCKHNYWNEDGPHCTNEKNWELEEDEKEIYMEHEDGEIEWSSICDNFEKGHPFC